MQCRVCGQDNPPEASFCGKCGAVLATTAEPAAQVAAPAPPMAAPAVQAEYMGFWVRFVAAMIDFVILGTISSIMLLPRYLDLLSSPLLNISVFFLPWLYFWLFTGLKGQTLGKMAVGIRVIDDRDEKPELGTAATREIVGKFISGAILCLGFLFIAIDKEKRGLHDSIAGTHVVRVEPGK